MPHASYSCNCCEWQDKIQWMNLLFTSHLQTSELPSLSDCIPPWWLLPCLSASWYSIREYLEKKGKEKGNRGLQWWDWRMFVGLTFEDRNSPRVSLGLQWSMQRWHHPLCARMPSWRLAVSIHPQRLAPGLYQFFIILNSNAGHVGTLKNLWKQLIFMAFKNQKKMLRNELKGTCSLLFWDPPPPILTESILFELWSQPYLKALWIACVCSGPIPGTEPHLRGTVSEGLPEQPLAAEEWASWILPGSVKVQEVMAVFL